jgi:hypothetical protein
MVERWVKRGVSLSKVIGGLAVVHLWLHDDVFFIFLLCKFHRSTVSHLKCLLSRRPCPFDIIIVDVQLSSWRQFLLKVALEWVLQKSQETSTSRMPSMRNLAKLRRSREKSSVK